MTASLGYMFVRAVCEPLRWEISRHVARWKAALESTAEVQTRLLDTIISETAQTAFGRDHGLDKVRNIDDLRKAMPIAGYERSEPYIERVARGEIEALFPPGTRIHMFALTSGTTGRAKHLPVTEHLLKQYRGSWQIWGFHAVTEHPDAFGAKILQISSRMDESVTPSGIPAGAISGLSAHMQRWCVRRMYVVPPEASYADDTATKYYLACRLGLDHHRVWPVTANPSTLLCLAREMDRRKDELIRDVADGTLSRNLAIKPEHRRRLEVRLRPNRRRARELEAVVRSTGRLYPKDVWDLPLVGTWKGGTLSLYLRELPQYWGDVPVRDIGLIASEARCSIPLQTEGSAGVLEPTGAFFEFVPTDEIESPRPTALLAHEVQVGSRYYIILTTRGGLFRYHIGDVVQVVDRVGQAPVIEFLNKGEHFSSLTGEKLTEFQVVQATNAVVSRLGLPVTSYCLCPTWDTMPYYSLLVEECDVPPARAAELASAVDAELRRLNIEYESKRESGRLKAIRTKTIPPGAWYQYDHQVIESRRCRVEQYKHRFLVNEVNFERQFRILAVYPPDGQA